MKISRRFLEALEEGDWASLPGQAYGRAFARSYGRFLGIDVQSLLPQLAPEPVSVPEPAAAPPGRPGATAVIAVALVVVLATFGWIVYASRNPAASTPPAKTNKKTSVPSVSTVPSSATVTATGSGTLFGWPAADYRVTPGPAEIKITFSGPCWIKVVADGRQLAAATYSVGTLTFSASSDLEVLFGRPQDVSATLSGTPLALGSGSSPVGLEVLTSP